MNVHIEYQTINQNGKPAFVVVPYKQFISLYPFDKLKLSIPHQVVKASLKNDMSLIRAWREYLKLTQQEVAIRMGVSQAALSQMEAPKAKLRKATLDKLAIALGIHPEQLR